MLKIFRLVPQGAYATELRSDTLFGIICWGAYWIYGEETLQRWIEMFLSGKPPFIISSVFPYTYSDDGKRIYFLPKPILKPSPPENPDAGNMQKEKKLKSLKWITHMDFNDLINGVISWKSFKEKYDSDEYPQPDIKDYQRSYNRFDRITWNTSGEEGRVFQDRFIRHVGDNPGGLYFFIETEQDELEKIVNIFYYWQHVGIGKNASIGMGKFDLEIDGPDWFDEPEKGHQCVTLSLYFPTKEEINLIQEHPNSAWYEVESRKGRVGGIVYKSVNPYKKGVNMFREGSSFPLFEKLPPGRILKVAETDDFKIFHSGFAFMIKSNFKEASI